MIFSKLISFFKNQDLVCSIPLWIIFLSSFTDLARAWGKSHKKFGVNLLTLFFVS